MEHEDLHLHAHIATLISPIKSSDAVWKHALLRNSIKDARSADSSDIVDSSRRMSGR
ncbi:hypothetical protein QJS10_CPA05g01633 [Acorus calamus]|uniref:Uncharacterized protein n=1 Tax=Acorus calamus TaxID=4465 RepID=A0AAV9EUH9_ACOCL|nr:hypothetical protein QJS10_CPA05g01633 [Acorus calamus]